MTQPAMARRRCLDGAIDDRLFFAQVREDPLLEIEALDAGPNDSVVVVSSGGCTALSLVATGTGHVVAVDLNRTQNHLVELKLAAVSQLEPDAAVEFLGGWPLLRRKRRSQYQALRPALSDDARTYWDRHRHQVRDGVLTAGVSERFIGVVMTCLRRAIHPPTRIRRLLASSTVADQQRLYDREWNSRRWRLLFAALLNRAVFRHTYSDAFFRHVDNPSFPRHFLALAERTLTQVPVATNYFVHQMLTGSYPRGVPGGLPPYLDATNRMSLAGAGERLELVDGAMVDHLRGCPDASVDGFALSNICEWLDEEQTDGLFAEIVRTAVPGARLVFRNFVGWTEVPSRWREAVVEDRAQGDALIAGDRSALQRRLATCRVQGGAGMAGSDAAPDGAVVARAATPADNAALVDLAEACPMEGDIGLCIRRRPDFFALNHLEGDAWQVGVVDGPDGTPIGCIATAERTVYLDGVASPSMYVSDLKVHPAHRGGGQADALTTFARDVCLRSGGADVPTFVTILAGNQAMVRRLQGPRGLPHLQRIATLRSHSVPLVWRRRLAAVGGLRIERAGAEDIDEMADLWQRVAPGRQFAPVHDADSLATWIDRAPSLEVSDYRLARRADGHLAGFVGVWDQSSFKQTVVTSYTRPLSVVRRTFNTLAPAVGAPRLPVPGGELRSVSAVHVCVPGDTPEVLRALVAHAYNELRGTFSFLSVGLDVADPLTVAMSGLLAQPTNIWACVATLDGTGGPAPGARPVHHEIALV